MHAATQEYLDRRAARAAVLLQESALALAGSIAVVAQDAAADAERLVRAELLEEDEEIRGLFEEASQKQAAIRRLSGELHAKVRELLFAVREAAAHDRRIEARRPPDPAPL